MIAIGDVVLVTDEGRRLESERLAWDAAMRSIEAEGFVSIQDKDASFQGYGFTASEDLSDWELLRPTGQFRVRE